MLSENIKKIRKSKGLTQKDLALQLNVVRQTVSKWEQGVSKGGKAPFWHTTLLAKCSVLYALSTADRAYMNTPRSSSYALTCGQSVPKCGHIPGKIAGQRATVKAEMNGFTPGLDRHPPFR